MRRFHHSVWLSLLLLPAAFTASGQTPLWQSQNQAQPVRAGRVSVDANGIGLKIDDPEWSSGMQLKPPAGQTSWDLSHWRVLALDVENRSATRQMRLTMHLSSGKRGQKDFREVNTGIGLNPGEKRTMRIMLPHDFLYRTPDGGKGMKVLDTAHLNPIEFQLQWPFEDKTPGLVDCRITQIRGEQPLDPATVKPVPPESYFPFIDSYGQYAHADWPEKIHTDADLKRQRETEARQLQTATRPAGWDRFGGWAQGPKLKATGNFRTEKYHGKWYLVDPDGRLFFSHGLDVLQPHTDATRIQGHEKWFAKLPDAGQPNADFTDHDLQIKYGETNYYADFYRTLSRRLEAWGINTVGNWARADFIAVAQTPYAMQLTDYHHGWPGIQGSKLKFYDVFDPQYAAAMAKLLPENAREDAVTRRSLTDPMCIGYFIDNELKFDGWIKELLKAPATQPGKREWANRLRHQYGDIKALNRAWKTDYADWDAFLNGKTVPANTEAFKKDSDEFMAATVDRYFSICRNAIKKTAPQRLYLGCRLVGFRQQACLWKAAARYCDVISVNAYSYSVANCNPANFHDKPALVGEFHFGTYDRGMFSASLCPAGVTQTERAKAYERFMQGVLVHPNLVGAHWFQFRDQPLTGRWDGEGYQLGFVDIADTPYPEMTAAARRIGEQMYRYRNAGKLTDWTP